MIPNWRFLTGVGRYRRGRAVLFWDDGASWAIAQGSGSQQAGRLIFPGTVPFPSK